MLSVSSQTTVRIVSGKLQTVDIGTLMAISA